MRAPKILGSLLGVVVVLAMPAGVAAQELPEMAVERSPALCGTDPNLPSIMREVHRAISEHRQRTTGSTQVVLLGATSADVGDVAVLEDQGDLVTQVLFVGGGPPRPGFVTDTTAIAQRFYQTHADQYDAIVILVGSTFGVEVEPESGFAFARLVKNRVQGIGLPLFDDTAALGLSTTKLKTIINMNDLGEYNGPEADVSGEPHHITGVEVLGQEVAHRWAAFVNTTVADILGRGDAHWSFFFNTDDNITVLPGASVMEGNGWADNGNGTFTTTRPFDSYSQLDEYVMGLRQPAAVASMPFVKSSSKSGGKKGGGKPPRAPGRELLNPTVKESDLPAEGVTVEGTAVTVTIQDVISANGPRVAPADESTVSNLAFILVIPNDGFAATVNAPDADVSETNAFRTTFASFYATQTEGLGSVTTTLTP